MRANTFPLSMLSWSAGDTRADAWQDSTQEYPNQDASGVAAQGCLSLGALLRLPNQ